ncbi:MAG TPA: hypothetical protein VFJ19_09560 [Nocardioidaceae bacterium]|nr:hypothetical protein [Nocardioidaceae bacterium]
MRTRRTRAPELPVDLADRIDAALEEARKARSSLGQVLAAPAPLDARRTAHADLRAAIGQADGLLRDATANARQRSYFQWCYWRGRLSVLTTLRQRDLFEESDDKGARRICSIRAIDTGMGGPAIGEMQHGESRPQGAPAAYEQDFEELLHASSDFNPVPVQVTNPTRPDDNVSGLPEPSAASSTNARAA